MNLSYAAGQTEAMLDIVPGLMPPAYVLGRMDAKIKKHSDKNKPGFAVRPNQKGWWVLPQK